MKVCTCAGYGDYTGYVAEETFYARNFTERRAGVRFRTRSSGQFRVCCTSSRVGSGEGSGAARHGRILLARLVLEEGYDLEF